MKVAAAVLIGLCLTHVAVAQPVLQLRLLGDPVPAVREPVPACGDRDFPDTPARAIRTAGGMVQLYATDRENRVDVGSDLLHLQHRCPVVFRGGGLDDPAAYNDRAWIAAPWTQDGRTIWAVVHNEFHGQLRPALCPTGRYMDCWFNALTLAVSHDGGQHFARASGDGLIAALPYRYDQVGLGHHGYFSPSNIVTANGYHFMFAFATHAGAQKNGNCLLRADAVERASAWRAWDGAEFGVQFVNPYAGPAQPEHHVCAPVEVGHLRWPVTSLVRHAASGSFIALMQDTAPGGGVYYATSPDLVRWSEPALLLAAESPAGWRCGGGDPIAYPSLLDATSSDHAFETVGTQAEMFATHLETRACTLGTVRRLVRWTVAIDAPKAVQRGK